MTDNTENIITSIDIGTTKTAVVIAESDSNQTIKILGVGESDNKGLKKGIVENVTLTAESIKSAIEEAENQAGVDVESAIVGLTGQHIKGINNTGVITVNSPGGDLISEREITNDDLHRVLEHTKAVTLPQNRRILHVLSQEYNVDNHRGIKNPLGMTGHRLEASVHLVTSDVRNEQNIESSLRRVNIDVEQFVLNPLASSYAVLDPNEKNLGVAMVDIGGGTTDVIVYHNDGVRHTGIVPIGSNNITSDIAHGLQTTIEQAEMLKINHGIAKSALAEDEKTIQIEGIGGREGKLISPRELSNLIEPRLVEIFALALNEIKKKDYPGFLTFGVILTGGGCLLNNAKDLALDVFQQPIKLATPIETGGFKDKLDDPRYSTAVGLAQYGLLNTDLNDQNDTSVTEWISDIPKLGEKLKDFWNKWI